MLRLPLLFVAFHAPIPFVTASSDAISVVQQLSSSNFGLSPGTEIFLRSDENWANETTQRYTIHDAPTYFASVKPVDECDVQKITKFASEFGIPFLATGGGHGFATTLGNLHDGIELDLGFFKDISVDAAASTMTVGGAVLIRDVIQPLYAAGKEMQTGSNACVGLVGATLGGGVGRLNGKHGMIADALLSVRLVTANGDIVTASATENSDLFWGIQGAGFNFGIVVSATYRVYDLTNKGQIMNADFLFAANQSGAVMSYFKTLETDQSADLAVILQTGYNIKYGGTYIVVNAAYTGPQSTGLPLVQPLLDAHPALHNITTTTYGDFLSTAFFGTAPVSGPCEKSTLHNIYSVGIKTYDVPTYITFFTSLQNFYKQYPAAQGSVFFIEAFPMQAARAVPDDQTAYPHRDINAHLLFNYGYTDPSVEGAVDAFAQKARAAFAATSGFDGLEVYVSYGHGDESPEVLYGKRKLPRLRALKQQWDPEGAFNFNVPFN